MYRTAWGISESLKNRPFKTSAAGVADAGAFAQGGRGKNSGTSSILSDKALTRFRYASHGLPNRWDRDLGGSG